MSKAKKQRRRTRAALARGAARTIPDHIYRPGRAEYMATVSILEKAFQKGLGYRLIKPDGTHVESVEELLSMLTLPDGFSYLDCVDETKP
jgi:hypothetical protein